MAIKLTTNRSQGVAMRQCGFKNWKSRSTRLYSVTVSLSFTMCVFP